VKLSILGKLKHLGFPSHPVPPPCCLTFFFFHNWGSKSVLFFTTVVYSVRFLPRTCRIRTLSVFFFVRILPCFFRLVFPPPFFSHKLVGSFPRLCWVPPRLKPHPPPCANTSVCPAFPFPRTFVLSFPFESTLSCLFNVTVLHTPTQRFLQAVFTFLLGILCTVWRPRFFFSLSDIGVGPPSPPPSLYDKLSFFLDSPFLGSLWFTHAFFALPFPGLFKRFWDPGRGTVSSRVPFFSPPVTSSLPTGFAKFCSSVCCGPALFKLVVTFLFPL